jgi:hypothetical protein
MPSFTSILLERCQIG